MSKSPWFPFYPSNWLNGTAALSLEETGAYIQITALLYDNENFIELERIEHPVTGKLEKYCYKMLARRLNTRGDKLKRIVERLVKLNKLSIVAGCITSAKVAEELAKIKQKSNLSREKAHKRWQVGSEKIKQINDYRMP